MLRAVCHKPCYDGCKIQSRILRRNCPALNRLFRPCTRPTPAPAVAVVFFRLVSPDRRQVLAKQHRDDERLIANVLFLLVSRYVVWCTHRPLRLWKSKQRSLGLLNGSMAAAAPLAMPATKTSATEYFDVLNEIGAKTGIVKARNHVHRDGKHVHTKPWHPLRHCCCCPDDRVKCHFRFAVQETGTELCMFGCMSKAPGICSFSKELLAKSLGPICGTYQQQGTVSFAFPEQFPLLYQFQLQVYNPITMLQLPLGISLLRQLSERQMRNLA